MANQVDLEEINVEPNENSVDGIDETTENTRADPHERR